MEYNFTQFETVRSKLCTTLDRKIENFWTVSQKVGFWWKVRLHSLDTKYWLYCVLSVLVKFLCMYIWYIWKWYASWHVKLCWRANELHCLTISCNPNWIKICSLVLTTHWKRKLANDVISLVEFMQTLVHLTCNEHPALWLYLIKQISLE